jgi:hypothetical protein
MMRLLFFVSLAVGLLSASALRAQVEVAPQPREIRADGTRDPAPAPSIAKKENPLEVVERIIKNSKTVGDKLAMTDTGMETRGTQATILKDIQSLIDQQENPPPKPDQNQDKNKDEKDKQPQDMNKKDDQMPMGGMNDMQPKKMDMNMGSGMPPPMGGNEDQPKGRRPRQQQGDDAKQDTQQKDPSGNKQQPQPMSKAPSKDPKNPGGVVPDPSMGDPKKSGPSLPFEDEVVKDVWGHLPDKLRQQATQYYQQDFMPRYTELLKLYYSSLAEKGGKK